MLEEKRSLSYGKFVRQVGIATTIPMILAAGPLVGYWIGQWVDRRFGMEPWGTVILALSGLAAGIKQVVEIIRRLNEETKKD